MAAVAVLAACTSGSDGVGDPDSMVASATPSSPTAVGTTPSATTPPATTPPVAVAPTTTVRPADARPGTTPPALTTAPALATVSASSVVTTTTISPIITPGEPARILVVGDSVAASLTGPDPVERFQVDGVGEIEVRNVGGVACPVILEGRWWFSDGSTVQVSPACDRVERYDDEVVAFAPDVVLTVFGWPGAGGGQRFPDGAVAVPCEARFDRAWASGYRSLIERLDPVATVAVATVAPISMDARRPETRCLNRIVRRLPAVVVDLQHWLCPDFDCSVFAALRPDGVHFATDPALRRRAMQAILSEVVAAVGAAAET